jgi:hypothetical protein
MNWCTCPVGKYWDSSDFASPECKDMCQTGQTLNPTTYICECDDVTVDSNPVKTWWNSSLATPSCEENCKYAKGEVWTADDSYVSTDVWVQPTYVPTGYVALPTDATTAVTGLEDTSGVTSGSTDSSSASASAGVATTPVVPTAPGGTCGCVATKHWDASADSGAGNCVDSSCSITGQVWRADITTPACGCTDQQALNSAGDACEDRCTGSGEIWNPAALDSAGVANGACECPTSMAWDTALTECKYDCDANLDLSWNLAHAACSCADGYWQPTDTLTGLPDSTVRCVERCPLTG